MFVYVLVAWFVLAILVTVGQVNKERTPITAGEAVLATIINLVWIVLILCLL